MRPAVNPTAPIAAGEIAGRVAALETTRAGTHSRRMVHGMKAAATRPCGMHAATAETSATVKTAGVHAATMETSTATVKASATAVKAATTAVKASATAVEAATATVASATTARVACLCRGCEHEPCDRAREDRGERHR